MKVSGSMSQGRALEKACRDRMRLRLRNLEARAKDFIFNQEVNLEATKNLWDCLTYLAGGAKHQSGSNGNLHLVNVTGTPVAMTYPGLSGNHMAGLPGETHGWPRRCWSWSRWRHFRLWGTFWSGDEFPWPHALNFFLLIHTARLLQAALQLCVLDAFGLVLWCLVLIMVQFGIFGI